MTPQFSSDLELAIGASKEAGKAIMEIYQTDFSYQMKADHSPVTQADLASDRIIKEILTKTAYPIISEETDTSYDYGQGKAWFVDPLDGTKDFIAKTGEFTVLIGLALDGKSIAGVVYQPVTGVMWAAEKNKGAYVWREEKWEQIHVSSTVELKSARITMSRHHLFESEQNILQALQLDYVKQGSPGFKMSQIASGNFDLYFAFGPKQWDVCASDIILREAGGMVSQINGDPILYGGVDKKIPNGIIAANGVYVEFVDFYKKYAKS